MTLRFVDIDEDVALDEDVFHTPWFCVPCHDWVATKAVVNDDGTWFGYACCTNEQHAAWAVQRHHEQTSAGETPTRFS